MSYRWVFQQPDDQAVVDRLKEELGVSETIAHLLAIRGVETYESAKTFFRPDLDLLYDPFLMKDMELGAARLAQAVREGEKVVVYGDYDVDGTTATSMMYTFLRGFGCPAEYYIPHRFKDGYGISQDGIEYAIDIGATLIVSVDCGITAVEEADYALKKGIDLVICDHHTAGDKIPNAVAVLDPKQPDCNYPFDGLSGAGVGFKLIQATLDVLGLPKSVAHKFLDLVAISIASDIVPVVDENRIIMRAGLKMLNTDPRPGIRALMDLIKMNIGRMTTTQIVFYIGPRINAAGRLGDARAAVKLLIADDPNEAAKSAKELESINVRRRTIDALTMEQAMEMIDSEFDINSANVLVLHDPEWHLGVIGIVASRLVDKFVRPAIMLSTVDGQIKGSARSIKGITP